MTESNDKKKLPEFKSLSEINRHIYTEMFGAEVAERIMQEADKLGKMRSKPVGSHLNGTMEKIGTEESGRIMQEVDAINKFNFPPEDTEYNN
jgi:hypothetical protein